MFASSAPVEDREEEEGWDETSIQDSVDWVNEYIVSKAMVASRVIYASDAMMRKRNAETDRWIVCGEKKRTI